MTDRERLYTAKLYIDRLANGMNPFDGEEIHDDTVLNDICLCRAFMFVSGILEEVIKNDCRVSKNGSRGREKFRITDAQKRAITLSQDPIGINAVSSRIAKVLDNGVKPIPAVGITTWLEAQGLLSRVNHSGKIHKEATYDGNTLGIYTEKLKYGNKEYIKTLYDLNAQAYIIENLENIAEFGA